MWCNDHLIELQQPMIGRWRLLAENVERRAGNRPARDRFVKRVLVNEAAASTVNDARALFHLADCIAIDKSTSFCGERRVDREKVCTRVDLVERGQLDFEIACLFGRNEWIVSNDHH